jgi:Protein of unknown function (DUF998)
MITQRLLVTGSQLGIGFFTGIVMLLHGVRRDLHPAHRYISEYSVGPLGWLMTVGFAGLSIGSAALVVALKRELPGARTNVSLIPMAGYSLAMGLVGAFRTDSSVPGTVATPMGRAHNTAGWWAARLVIVAMFLLSLTFRRHDHWRDLGGKGVGLAITAALALFSLGRWPAGRPGVSQRAFFASVLLWLGMLSRRLATMTDSPDKG